MTEREALKLALGFVEEHARHWTGVGRSGRDVVTAIKEALAQEALDKKAENARELGLDYEPEQEPVAWIIESEEYNAEGERPILREIDYYNQVIDQFPAGTKLYTTPPQRKPLSDEELFKIWLRVPAETEDRFAFARAIEAAHGIKGEA